MKVGQRIRYKGKPARVAFVNQRGVWIKHYGDLVSTRAKPADLEELPPSPRQVRRDAMILAVIEDQALDRYDIATKVHATPRHILDCLTRLHDADPKRVFIRSWRTGTTTPVPLYQAGDDPDAPRPRARTTREQNRIGHARRKAEREPKPKCIPTNHALVRTGTVVYTSRPAAARRSARAAWDALVAAGPIVSLRLVRGEWIALRSDGAENRLSNSFK